VSEFDGINVPVVFCEFDVSRGFEKVVFQYEEVVPIVIHRIHCVESQLPVQIGVIARVLSKKVIISL